MGSQMPERWRKRVCDILAAGDLKRILVRKRAIDDWSALFPHLFTYHLYEALTEALSDDNLAGNEVFGMDEPGQVYEFIFTYEKRLVYAKLNLCPDGTVVIVYSAHRPLKGNQI